VEPFTFAIVVPAGPGSQALVEALAEQVAGYAGLAPDGARQAADALGRLVAERPAGGTPVRVSFARTAARAAVGIEIAGDGPVHTLTWPAASGG
jgi:hypothetical protein